MKLFVCIDPTVENTHACSRILRGVRTEASKRRYAIETIDGLQYKTLPYDTLFEKEPRQILLVGQYTQRLSEMVSFFDRCQIKTIIVGGYLGPDYTGTSSVMMDYPQMIKTALNYLAGNGRTRTALLGIDQKRSPDIQMQESFMRFQHRQGVEMAEYLCFPIHSSIEECCEEFATHIDEYDSVLCCSDDVAIYLIEYGKMHGFGVPDDLFLISCGAGSTISEIYSPTITTVTTHYSTIGKQAVQIAPLLSKQDIGRSIDVRVAGELNARESTDSIPFDPHVHEMTSVSKERYVDIGKYRYLHMWTSIGPEKDLDFFGVRLFGWFGKEYSALYLHTRTRIHLDGTCNGLMYKVDLLSNHTNCAAVLPAGFEGHLYIPLDAFVEYEQILSEQPDRPLLHKLHHISLILPGERNGHLSLWNDFEVIEHLPDADGSVGDCFVVSCFDSKVKEPGETTMSDLAIDAPLFHPMGNWRLKKSLIDGQERFSLQSVQQWKGDIFASFVCGTHYFADPDRQSIANIEILLGSCNLLDLKIILGLMEHYSYAALSEMLYASINTIKYRVNHMIQMLGLHTKAELVDTLSQSFPAEMLETIRRACSDSKEKLPWENQLL